MQTPIYRECGFQVPWKRKIIGYLFPKVKYSPVRYRDYPFKPEMFEIKDEHKHFVPFVMPVVSQRMIDRGENKRLRFLDVGKYRDYKNHFVLVDAVSLLDKQEVAKIEVTILGQAINENEVEYYSKLEQYIFEKGLENCFTLQKNIEYSEMSQIYTKHDVFILTSKRETASISVIEAMAYGLPVITTNKNGTSDYIKDGETGYVFISEDPKSLMEKIRQCIIDGVEPFYEKLETEENK